MMKVFKKISLCFLFLLTIVFTMSNTKILSAYAWEYKDYDFTTISEEESIDFVEYHNIDIPKKIENSPNLGKITSDIIKIVANDLDYSF